MSITISIDNDRSVAATGIQSLIEDETLGVQTPGTADTGNELDVTLSAGVLGGFLTAFNTYLNGLSLSTAQKEFARDHDGASSASDLVLVTTTAGEIVSDLFFSDAAGNALDGDAVAGMFTVAGNQQVYLWSFGDYCIASTSNVSAFEAGSRVVAAFYLNEASDHKSAQVQMVTFEALSHPDGTNADDALNFTNVLQVSASGSTSFNFNSLQSGSSLWVAVGSSSGGVLVTGGSPSVDSAGKYTNTSDVIHTSQGGDGTTIGVNNQLFDSVGEKGVFTLVSGLDVLNGTTNGFASDYIADHGKYQGVDYSGYLNVTGAGIYISQSQGNGAKDFDINLLTAGGGTTPEEGTGYISGLAADTAVNVGTVTIKDDDGNIVGVWGVGGLASGSTVSNHVSANGTANVQVTITGNNIDVNGVLGEYTVSWTTSGGATFNRFTLIDEAGQFDVGRVDILQGVASHTGVGGNLIVQDDGPSITGTLTGAPTPTVDETTFAIDGTGNFAPQFSPIYGSDGAAATGLTYALSTPGGNSGLVDTATRQNVVLSLNVGTGQIEGRTATSNQLVFIVSVSSAGVVTLDQQRAVVHADGTDPNDSRSLTAANLVVLTATAHDKDGDVASAALNIGQQLIFSDDGPSITASLTGAPHPTVDESNLAADDTDSFAGQFSPVYGADGQAATPVTYALSTSGGDSGLIDTASGNHVFLFLESGKVVGREGTDATDAATGDIVFEVSVDSSGGVKLDQKSAIVHPTSDPDESKTLAGTGLVVLTGTVHDKDGDTASAPLDISQQLLFKDDGPSITATITNAPSPTVDETTLSGDDSGSFAGQFTPVYGADGQGATPAGYALSTPGGDSGLVDTASGHAVYLFLESGQVVGREGTDAADAATGDIVFVVSVDSSGNVGLDQQRAIVHPTTDPDESKTLASAGLVVLTATATDKDGDSASTPLNIGTHLIFKDDGPSMSASSTGAPTITDDETNLGTNNSANYAGQFTPTYGADGQGATPVTYALSTLGGDSGIVDTVTGNAVFLFLESGKIVGREGTSALDAATGDIVFEVSVGSTGSVTLDQKRAVAHLPDSGIDQSTTLSSAGLVVLTATAHDKDGDIASATLNLGTSLIFNDDSPTITAQISDGLVEFATDGTGTVSHTLNGSVGADVTNATQQSSTGVKQYTITSWSEPHDVYPNLDAVLSSDGTTLTYYSDVAHTDPVYQLSLNQTANSGAGAYTFTVLKAPPIVESNFGFEDFPSGQNLAGVIAVHKTNVDNNGTPGNASDDFLPDGGLLVFSNNMNINDGGAGESNDGTMTNTSGTVNTSKGGGGVTIGNTNQAFDHAGEGSFFCYVDNPLTSAVGTLGLTQVTADDADTIKFNGTNEATTASVEIVQASGRGTAKSPGPAMHIFAYDVNPGNVDTDAESRAFLLDPTNNATESNIIGVKIYDASHNLIEYRTNLDAGATNNGALGTGSPDSAVAIQFVLDDPGGAGTADDIYSTVVSNLKANYTIEFITETGHDLALVENVSGSFDIGGFNVKNSVNVPAQDFDFSVQINDYDNDHYGGQSVTYANFGVTIDGILF
jgi:hypothetical protein